MENIEEWRQVEGWPYEVSNLGRIRTKAGLIKNPTIAANGYFVVSIQKTAHLHELICAAFHGPKPSPDHEVRHLNGIKTDIVPTNLKWGTSQENALDREHHGTILRGDDCPWTVYDAKTISSVCARYREIVGDRKRAPNRTFRLLAEEFGVSYDAAIYMVKRGSVGNRVFTKGRSTVQSPSFSNIRESAEHK